MRAMQSGDTSVVAEDGQTVIKAVTMFLEDKQQQHVGDGYYSKLDLLLRKEFLEFCRLKPVVYLRECNLSVIEEFRKGWKGVAITKKKKQERFRSFFHYCVRHEWMKSNPAVNLSRIKVEQTPTDYFTDDEFKKLLASIGVFGQNSRNPNSDAWRKKLRALILLMRWSGLRIGDAVTLERSKLVKNKIMLRTEKTGVVVYTPIPENVAEELRSIQNSNPAYFFWSGNGNRKSVVSDYQRSFRRLCVHAKLGKRSHLHMMRDSYAIGLLLSGVPLDQVSILLGHSSIKITEKHYAPWVKARQEQLEQSVQKSWTIPK